MLASFLGRRVLGRSEREFGVGIGLADDPSRLFARLNDNATCGILSVEDLLEFLHRYDSPSSDLQDVHAILTPRRAYEAARTHEGGPQI